MDGNLRCSSIELPESMVLMTAIEDMSWFANPEARSWQTTQLGSGAHTFHRGLPGYVPTPLVEISPLANELNVGKVFVKDESSRLGLPAFKILGASYAVSRALSKRLGSVDEALPLHELRDRLVNESVRLVAATDGNHGRAVAHVARDLGLPARIFYPSSLTVEAKGAIVGEGAETVEMNTSYDELVSAAAEFARLEGSDAVLIQDTAWPGYEEVPRWIVEGYSTLFAEADEQLLEAGIDRLDVVVVPVGVGSLAQAAVRHYRSIPHPPVLLTVEAERAPALVASLHAGRSVSVPTTDTIMAGLNCGTPSAAAWPSLFAGVDAAVTVTEDESIAGVRRFAELGVDAGPCGAATLAGARRMLLEPARRAQAFVDADAVVLLFSTEGSAANPLPAPVVTVAVVPS